MVERTVAAAKAKPSKDAIVVMGWDRSRYGGRAPGKRGSKLQLPRAGARIGTHGGRGP